MPLKKLILPFILLAVSHHVAATDAPAALVPPGLAPGDTFFIIFAGSDKHIGEQDSAIYASYAASVAAKDADTSSIAGWTTLFGHFDGTLTTTSAFGGVHDRPIYNTRGDKVADDRDDMFDGDLDNPVGYDEAGNPNAGTIWTGFLDDGTRAPAALVLASRDITALFGRSDVTVRWASTSDSGHGELRSLFVLSPLLTVPDPVSGSTTGLNW